MVVELVILIVEDEPLMLMDAADAIKDAGFDVLEASNADEAVAVLEARSDVALVFTDIEMPAGSFNGLRLAAAVHDRWPPVKIIVTSGRVSVSPSDLPSGAIFIAKPYSLKTVASAVKKLAA